MPRVGLVVMLAACSDPAVVPDAGVDAAADAANLDALAVSPIGHDFGDYEIGSGDPPARFTFEVAATGPSAADLTAIEIAGTAASDFAIVANDCGAMLAPADTCKVRIEFIATAAGERVAMLQITGTTSVTVPLSGTGIPPPARIRFSPTSRNFGDVAIGATSGVQVFTVSNETIATTLTASFMGPGAAGYRIASTDCASAPIPLHGTCTVQVELVPPFGGEFLGDLVLTDTGGTAWKAGLYGASTTPLALAPYTGLFTSILIGQTAPGELVTFVVTNTGTATTGPITATPIGTDGADFTVRSTTCTTLAPSATCSVVVEMTPTTRGAKHAELAVTDTVTETRSRLRGDAYSLLVTGTAGFPDTSTGQQSAVQSFTVINASDLATGAITTTQSGPDPTEFAIAGNDCATGIAAHAQCTIMVRFTPTSTGAKSASLIVAATPGGSDTFVITGRGI
jgi:hypothetical protein